MVTRPGFIPPAGAVGPAVLTRAVERAVDRALLLVRLLELGADDGEGGSERGRHTDLR